MESSSPGIKFQPRDYRGDPIYGGGNDNTGDRYAIPQQSHNTTKARHLQDLVEQTCRDLDPTQRHRLATILSEYSEIFPVPGAPLTGHTDAVEHDINMGDRPPIRCAPRRMSEECVAEMLAGGQIEPSDSPWSSPVVLVTKKMAAPGSALTITN